MMLSVDTTARSGPGPKHPKVGLVHCRRGSSSATGGGHCGAPRRDADRDEVALLFRGLSSSAHCPRCPPEYGWMGIDEHKYLHSVKKCMQYVILCEISCLSSQFN